MSEQYTLQWLAEFLACPWQGDPSAMVSGLADLETASSRQLSFLNNKRYQKYLDNTQAGIVLLRSDQEYPSRLNVILCEDPYLGYAKISALFSTRPQIPVGVHPSAVIDDDAYVDASAAIAAQCVVEAGARIGAGTQLFPGVVIGARAVLGENCLIYPKVTIYHDCTLGDRVTIHANSVIGSDGFGYAPLRPGWQKIHQVGAVKIGNDVEIGASVAIDRGAIGDTVIEDGVIMDNQIHMAHNVKVGRNTAIAGCVGMAGSTTIGENCTFGGMVGISGHINITDNAHFNGGSSIIKDIKDPGVYSSGTLLQEVKAWRKNALRLSQIDEWIEKIKKLEKLMDNKNN